MAVFDNLLKTLPILSVERNYTPKGKNTVDYIVRGAGRYAADVAGTLIESVQPDEKTSRLAPAISHFQVGRPHDIAFIREEDAALRFVACDHPKHQAVCDVLMQPQANALHIRISTGGATPLKYLRPLTYGVIFLFFWLLITNAYVHVTGYYDLCLAFGRKHFPIDPQVAVSALSAGMRPVEGHWVAAAKPWTFLDFLTKEPGLLIQEFSRFWTILSVCIGGILYYLPPGIFRIPCRFLGWPTPEEFDAFLVAHAAFVRARLSEAFSRNGFGAEATEAGIS